MMATNVPQKSTFYKHIKSYNGTVEFVDEK